MSMYDYGAFAFPAAVFDPEDGELARFGGMTLRDWFAGQVVAGWGQGHHVASINLDPRADFPDSLPDDARYAQRMAAFAYKVADAMIAAGKAAP
jgi:hypothetical protein